MRDLAWLKNQIPGLAGLRFQTPGLAGRLAIATGLLVALAVGSMYGSGVNALRGLAQAEALTRVELAVAAAREGMRQGTEESLTAARILGERPTLQRLLRDSSGEAVSVYLSRNCEGAEVDACAVVQHGEIVTATTSDLDWQRVLDAAAEQGERFLVTGATEATTVGGATAPVVDSDGFAVVTVRRLDSTFAQRLSERTGLAIGIIDYESFQHGEGPLAVVHSDALLRDEPISVYVDELDAYVSSLSVAAATGETVALLQATLPAADIAAPVDAIAWRMLLWAVTIAALAAAGAVFLGRYWISAIERLTEAAQRLGSGDLTTSFRAGGGRELTTLGNTMEQMRRNLVELTGELRRREAEAQAVLGGIIEGVYAVDAQRRIRFLNPQAERLLKVDAANAIGAFCGDVLKPLRDRDGRRPCEHACPILEARREGSARAVERIVPVADDDVRRVVIASAAPADADGLQVQVLRDETELEAVRRTRDSVLANISHEFRTPLAAQLASIELLRDGVGTMQPDAQRQLVGSLQRGTQRLTWLIDNLLESVRIDAGQLGIRHQDVTFDDVVVAARELIEPLIEQRGQRIVAELDANTPVIRGDQQRLTQVLVNLLANASKFGPADSTIRIGSRADGAGLELWVEDEGAGPSNPDDGALFEQFHRSGGEKDPDESGLGVGLFIVRSIVERHGGSVRLVRTLENRTRAEVRLPPEPPEPPQ